MKERFYHGVTNASQLAFQVRDKKVGCHVFLSDISHFSDPLPATQPPVILPAMQLPPSSAGLLDLRYFLTNLFVMPPLIRRYLQPSHLLRLMATLMRMPVLTTNSCHPTQPTSYHSCPPATSYIRRAPPAQRHYHLQPAATSTNSAGPDPASATPPATASAANPATAPPANPTSGTTFSYSTAIFRVTIPASYTTVRSSSSTSPCASTCRAATANHSR